MGTVCTRSELGAPGPWCLSSRVYQRFELHGIIVDPEIICAAHHIAFRSWKHVASRSLPTAVLCPRGNLLAHASSRTSRFDQFWPVHIIHLVDDFHFCDQILQLEKVLFPHVLEIKDHKEGIWWCARRFPWRHFDSSNWRNRAKAVKEGAEGARCIEFVLQYFDNTLFE